MALASVKELVFITTQFESEKRTLSIWLESDQVRSCVPEEKALAGLHIPENPPLPFIASIWRIIFFAPPPFIILIIFCICWNCFRS